jgi:iron complex outermembrane receptor protein
MLEALYCWRGRFVAAVSVIALLGPVHAQAQTSAATAAGPTTGALSGAVLDPEGKAVVNATVLIRNEATSELKTVMSDASGRFMVTGLPAGSYTVEVAVPGFDLVQRTAVKIGTSTQEISIQLTVANIAETVTVSAALPEAAVAAPSQSSLTARSAQSLISPEFIRNYTSPVSDYSQVLQMAPGTFSTSSNGVGLGDTKTFFRGFKDGYYSMTYDGIPFGDTNDPTHHSWAFFPAQTIGSTVFDRSPGAATSVGPSTYGGSVTLLSRSLGAEPLVDATVSYGSFNTKLFDFDYNTGRFGPSGTSRLFVDAHDMRSDGYQTYNFQHRQAFSAKYQFTPSSNTNITAFTSTMLLHTNTPNQKGSTRAQLAQFGNNFLMTNDPTSPLYYKFNFYRIPTDFEYVGVRTLFGHGWSIDDKVYTMRYYNKQNYNGVTTITATSATDKLNSYRKYGNLLPVQQVSEHGVLRTGLWSELALTDRYQTPSDPRTWIDAALPNFHEKFHTTTMQPYVEYEFRLTPQFSVTPGYKYAWYKQDFTQFADNGKTVGNLNGAPFIRHAVTYHASLPQIDGRYLLQSNWSVYAQYARGQNIPPSSVFDVKNAQVGVPPKPILSKSSQVGSVWKSRRATLDVDYYHINLQADYSSTVDPATGDTVFFLNGQLVTQGVEAESTILTGGGLAVYLNGTKGKSEYTDSKLWSQNAPSDTETIGLTYNHLGWNVGYFDKRIGQIWQDNGAAHQAIALDPFTIQNIFVNYTIGGTSRLSATRIRFAVNNLQNSHAITAITPASTLSNAPAAGDLLGLMAGRSASVSMTVGVRP